jgi:hypothetical protein
VNKSVLLACLAIAIPLSILFGPALVSDRSFALRDAGHFYYPLFEWCCGEWAAGRVPLWNPYENCGLPVLGDATSSVFYPGKLLFLLPVDFAFRYRLYLTMHVVLAAVGAYRLAHHFEASREAAALAGIAYACGGSVVFQYCNTVFLVGAAWLPLAAIAADRMLRRSCAVSAMQLGLVLALMILGGDPQAAYHALLATALYATLLTWSKETVTSPLCPRFRPFLIRVALVGLAAGAAFLLAAVQVLPSAEATRTSERAAFNRPRNIYEAAVVAWQPSDALQPLGETRSESIARGLLADPEADTHHELAYEFSVGPWRLAEYVWPNLYGRMFPTHRRWISLLPAEGRAWTPTLYLGLFPLLLALLGLRFRSGTPHERWFSLIVVIFTLGSFGYYGLGWLLREISGLLPTLNASAQAIGSPVGGVYWLFVTLLPAYAFFRYPAKLLPLVSLGLCPLAGLQFDAAFAARRPWLSRILLTLGICSGIAAGVVWCFSPALFGNPELVDPLLGPFDPSRAHRDLVLALVQAATVALVGWWLLQRAWHHPAKLAQWKLLAVLLTAVDVAAANSWLVVTAPAQLWRDESPIAAAIHAQYQVNSTAQGVPRRVYRGNLATWSAPSFRQKSSELRSAELAKWERDTLLPKYPLAASLSLVESFGSIRSVDHASLLRVAKQYGPRQPDKSLLPQPTALRLLGTEFIVLPEKQRPEFAEHIPAADTSWPESAALWRMQRTMPRAWIVHDVETIPPLDYPARIETLDERSKAVLFPNSRARDFARWAVIESDSPPVVPPLGAQNSAAESESCQITHYDPQRVVVEATLAQPGLVVLSDTWFPGWQARVTTMGQTTTTPIHRTNRILRGVWLPAGESEIEFRYRPGSFVRGAAISTASWVLLAIGAAVSLARRRKSN